MFFSRTNKVFSLLTLTIITCVLFSIKASSEQQKLNIVYIHGAKNSSVDREKAFPKEGEVLHKSLEKSLKDTVPFAYYGGFDTTYFYWGDILRDDAESFENYPLKQTLRKSKGKINTTLKEALMPIVYDAEWLQDEQKIEKVLNRLNTEIVSKNEPFVILSHSAGTLVAYDYLTRRLSLFDAKELITKKYKLDEELSNRLPEKTCMDLLNKYNPQITNFASEEINFLKDAFNNVSVELIEDEIEIAKKLIGESVKAYEEKYQQVKNNAQSSICIAILPKLQDRLNRKKEIKELINSKTLFYDSLVYASEEQAGQIEELKGLIENLKGLIETQGAKSGYLKNEETSLLDHLQGFLVSEEKTYKAIQKILETKPGLLSKWSRSYTESIIDSLVKDHKDMCVSPDKFVGAITFASPIPLFRAQQLNLFTEKGSTSNAFLTEIYTNGKFWIHFNHAEDPIGVSIPDDLFTEYFSTKYKSVKKAGLITDNISTVGGVSLLKCRGPHAIKCPHNWYWYFPGQFTNDLKSLLEKHYQSDR